MLQDISPFAGPLVTYFLTSSLDDFSRFKRLAKAYVLHIPWDLIYNYCAILEQPFFKIRVSSDYLGIISVSDQYLFFNDLNSGHFAH